MDRRAFLFKLCGVGTAAVGTAVLGPLLIAPAEATPLDLLKDLPAPEPAKGEDAYGAAPDGTPADSTYWVWRNGRRYWVPPRRRRRVCRRVWTRWGWRRQCWWR